MWELKNSDEKYIKLVDKIQKEILINPNELIKANKNPIFNSLKEDKTALQK